MTLQEITKHLETMLGSQLTEIQEWNELKERVNDVQYGIDIYQHDTFEYSSVSELLYERDWYRVVLKYLWTGEK